LDDDPVTKVKLFLWQILHGNTACSAKSGLSDELFSGAGYCKARMIALNPLRDLAWSGLLDGIKFSN